MEYLKLHVNLVVFPLLLSQGHPRTETPLPNSVSLYSDRVPNTSNQMFGSGLYTELGKELIRLDNLLTLTANHRKAKRNPEMQPCWGLPGTGCVQNTLQCISSDLLLPLENFPWVVLFVLPLSIYIDKLKSVQWVTVCFLDIFLLWTAQTPAANLCMFAVCFNSVLDFVLTSLRVL